MSISKWQPVIWGGIFVLMLLSIAIPIVNAITMFLVMVPVFVLFMRVRLRTFFVTMLVVMILMWGLLGGLGMVLDLLSLFLMPPVLVMGTLYRRGATAKMGVMAGIMTMIGAQLLMLLIGYVSGLDPIGSYRSYMDTVAGDIKNLFHLDPEVLTRSIRLIIQVIPLMMVSMAAALVVTTHGVGCWIVRRGGGTAPGLPPLRQWRLPKSMIFYYLTAVILNYFLDINADTILVTIVLNLLPALTIAFVVQALSFLYYVVHLKRWSRLLPVGAVVLMVLFFPSMYLFSLLGLIDTAFPIRDRISGGGQ